MFLGYSLVFEDLAKENVINESKLAKKCVAGGYRSGTEFSLSKRAATFASPIGREENTFVPIG